MRPLSLITMDPTQSGYAEGTQIWQANQSMYKNIERALRGGSGDDDYDDADDHAAYDDDADDPDDDDQAGGGKNKGKGKGREKPRIGVFGIFVENHIWNI